MNSNFSDNQIKAYAAAFEEGDAIWCDGEWVKVYHLINTHALMTESTNPYVIRTYDGDVVADGFNCSVTPYRVTTLEDYVLRGGEKIVWLGKHNSSLTFGKVYEVDSNARYRDDSGDLLIAKSSLWTVIPRYDQVKTQKEVEASDIVNTLHKRYYTGIQNMLRDDIQNALTDGDYREVIKLSKMMIEMEEQQ